MDANVDFLAADVDVEENWVFEIPATVSTVSQQPGEILDCVEAVLDCLSPFTKFRSCELTVQLFEEDVQHAERIDTGPTDVRTVKVDLEESETDGDRVTAAAIRERLARIDNPSDYALVSTLSFADGATRVRLDGFDGDIDTESTDLYRTVKHGEIRGPARLDPIQLEISDKERLGDDAGMIYEIRLRTPTEIWFGRNELAEVNRERFADALSCLHRSFPDGDRHFGGEPRGECAPREQPWIRPLVPWFDGE
ncbi:hypothetical protein [Halomicrobium salinisoli]|uniref:hypothetical protein n=1 Tax=Halomicrobium salinisoli TaxID=2878391 RepID=UPI001CEFED38|nr:hypothetical protein [Halomicrobium salinisoli]